MTINYIWYYPNITSIIKPNQIKSHKLYPEHNRIFTPETSMFDIWNAVNEESFRVPRVIWEGVKNKKREVI